MRTTAIHLICAVSVFGGCAVDRQKTKSASIPPGQIRNNIESAKAAKQTHTEIEIANHDLLEYQEPLDVILAKYSVLVAKFTGQSTTDVQPNSIFTWYKFDVVEQLRVKSPTVCGYERPKTAIAGPGQTLLPLAHGTITVDGVTLVFKQALANVSFVRGAEYLLLVQNCGDMTVAARLGPAGMFRVEQTGALSALFPSPERPPFVEALTKMTKAALISMLRKER